MARIRSIKPETWHSADFCSLSRNARLLYIALWNFADDAGRGDARPIQVKIEVFPADDDVDLDTVQQWLLELHYSDVGFTLYESDDKPYYHIPEKSWKHQKIDRSQPPKFPEPTSTFPRVFVEYSSNARRTDTERSTNEEKVSEPNEIIEETKDSTTIRRTFDDHSSWKDRRDRRDRRDQGGRECARTREEFEPKPEVEDVETPTSEPETFNVLNWRESPFVWHRVVACWIEKTGNPVDVLTQKKASMSIARQCLEVEPNDPYAPLERAVDAWLSDPWVVQNRPTLGHLASQFAKYVNGSVLNAEQSEDIEKKISALIGKIGVARSDLSDARSFYPEKVAHAEAVLEELKNEKAALLKRLKA
jgi:hypothetical protein